MNRKVTITAAVAAALSGGTALAAAPSIAAINLIKPANTIYIAGSSAIKNALTNAIINTFCGGAANTAVITTTAAGSADKNWDGFACTPVAGMATNGGNYLVDYRFEGGSVAGYLPVVNGVTVNQIDGPTLTALALDVTGSTEANGQSDTFGVSSGGSFTKHAVDLGIGDVEPKAITGNNYPTDYCMTVWGASNPSGMFSKAATGLVVDEVYAVFVNETGGNFTETPLNLSVQTLSQILQGNITDWSKVTDVAGNAVVSASTPILVVNREYGSGSRTATDVLIVGDGCGAGGSAASLIKQKAQTRYFSTGDVLAAAGSVAGAVTYASIDNAPATNLQEVTIDGVVATNLAAATGAYPFWVEAAYINNSATTGADTLAINNIVAGLQDEASTAALSDIDAIPNVASANGANGGHFNTTVHANPSNSGVVPTGGGTATVYINPYSRQGITCSAPADFANTFP
jgi:hypothetical protein